MTRQTPNARRAARGFTLIEILSVLGIASVLSSIAWPSFQSSLHKARRADALVAVAQVQIAQERSYANRRRYAGLAELRTADRSSAGHYLLEMQSADERGYELMARATGSQAGDVRCRVLKLSVIDGTPTLRSGEDDRVANDAAANRRCWGL
ncbi:type IV pilin protein [Variovorax sp. YR752]|uniref:type IV pilin protein n=1 Tax=Variovorax sp. YR752 TaxID=1884383 RepID=UPI00313773E5